jgi:hypothetical protein
LKSLKRINKRIAILMEQLLATKGYFLENNAFIPFIMKGADL